MSRHNPQHTVRHQGSGNVTFWGSEKFWFCLQVLLFQWAYKKKVSWRPQSAARPVWGLQRRPAEAQQPFSAPPQPNDCETKEDLMVVVEMGFFLPILVNRGPVCDGPATGGAQNYNLVVEGLNKHTYKTWRCCWVKPQPGSIRQQHVLKWKCFKFTAV